MSDGIYVSMNGASARLAQLDAISDNLANAQTPGFKAERPAFEAFLANADQRLGASKVYPAAVGTRIDLSHGPVERTDAPLDVLPGGDAYLGVLTEKGVALTRAGRLTVAADGTLTAAGHPVVDTEGRPIVAPPNATVRIEPDGQVYANQQPLQTIALYEASGPLDRVGPALLAPQDPAQLSRSTQHLRIGEIETGNASALEAAVQLVSAQRQFEASVQALQTYKRLDDRATDVGRVK